jgi:hypothetical protein
VIAPTTRRVAQHTTPSTSERLRHQLHLSIAHHAAHPDQIAARLRELDEEWDIERVLETNSSILSLFGIVMGFAWRRRWFLLPLAVQGFFLQHALQGWCPPVPLLRRLGFRTQSEIEQERWALKALRGDFADLCSHEAESPKERQLAVLRVLESA